MGGTPRLTPFGVAPILGEPLLGDIGVFDLLFQLAPPVGPVDVSFSLGHGLTLSSIPYYATPAARLPRIEGGTQHLMTQRNLRPRTLTGQPKPCPTTRF